MTTKIKIENVSNHYLSNTHDDNIILVKPTGSGVIEIPPGDSVEIVIWKGITLQIFEKGETELAQDVFIP